MFDSLEAKMAIKTIAKYSPPPIINIVSYKQTFICISSAIKVVKVKQLHTVVKTCRMLEDDFEQQTIHLQIRF